MELQSLPHDDSGLGLEWIRHTHPVTEHFAHAMRSDDLTGKSVSCWMHLLPDTILSLMPLVEAGASVRIGACNPDSTDRRVVDYLTARGVEVYPGGSPSSQEYQDTLKRFASGSTDAICDMGGELIEAATLAGTTVSGALEATTTGLHRLAEIRPPFPVFNWNDIRIKDALHNRYHVGDSTWPAFSAMTGMTLFGRSVLVIGFGPVGRGVAERARQMGAVVRVCDLDPVRSLEAQHFGCEAVGLEEGLSRSSIVVTSTGRDGVLGMDMLSKVRDGAILFNVGHSNREIDVDWLDRHSKEQVIDHIERYVVAGRRIYLLNRGSMINLASTGGLGSSDTFDPFAGIMLRGLHWILTGGADNHPAGVQDYPAELENEIALETMRNR